MATKKVRRAPFLSYKFRVGNQEVEFRVPPMEGKVLRIQAWWSGHGPHTLDRDGHLQYMQRRNEVQQDALSKLGMRGTFKYEIIHGFTSSLVRPTGSDTTKFGGH